jgi:hypothetical protein
MPLQRVFYRPDDAVVFLSMPGVPAQPILDLLQHNIPSDHLVRGSMYGEWRGQIAAPLCVTLLRDPITRTLASYRNDQRIGTVEEDLELEAYLSETRFEDRVDNVQVRRLIGDLPQPITPEASLFLAQEHLQQCALFGLAEQVQESVLILRYCFGWPVKDGSTPAPLDQATAIQLDQLSPKVRDLLIQRNHMDIALYEIASHKFEQSLTQLVATLLNGQLDEVIHDPAGDRPIPGLETHVALRTMLMLREMRLRLFPPGSRREQGYSWLRGKVMR